MDTLKIGRYIQHLRKSAGMTQKELAEKLNISFQAVSKWENGDTLPDTGILLDLWIVIKTFTGVFTHKDIYENKVDDGLSDNTSAELAQARVIEMAHE